jgi:hypothetical protein
MLVAWVILVVKDQQALGVMTVLLAEMVTPDQKVVEDTLDHWVILVAKVFLVNMLVWDILVVGGLDTLDH